MIVVEQLLLADGGGALEDAVFINDHIAVLLDGGTGIGERLFSHDQSDARLFVRRLADALGAAAGKEGSLKELLRGAHGRVVASLHEEQPNLAQTDPSRMPIATCVLVRWREGQFEGVVYGDVACLHENAGARAVFHDERVIEKDRVVLERFVELQRAGASAEARRAELTPLVLADRRQNFFDQHYSVITLNPASIDSGIEFTIADDGKGRVVLASDGFLREADVFGGQTREEVLTEALHAGLWTVGGRVRALECGDPDRTSAPRLKDKDDMAAVSLRFAT